MTAPSALAIMRARERARVCSCRATTPRRPSRLLQGTIARTCNSARLSDGVSVVGTHQEKSIDSGLHTTHLLAVRVR
eukprot:scaffold309726_cov30-Tisochrysis_lutea.AAC.4